MITKITRNKALEIFKKALPEEYGRIKSIKDIHNGYTNYSFLVKLEDGTKYQVRIPHSSDLINRTVEYGVLELVGNNSFVYFDKKTGIAIKKWIEGSHPSKLKLKSKSFQDILFNEIKHLHTIAVDEKVIPIKKIAINSYNQHLHDLAFEYQKKYLCLLDRIKDEKLVLSHSDINPLNLIIDENDDITLIDFEWCCLASDYWDYVNWVRETNTDFWRVEWKKYIDNFSMELFIDYLFLCSTFAYAWTFAMPQDRKILAYRKQTLKQVKKYYDILIDYANEKECK